MEQENQQQVIVGRTERRMTREQLIRFQLLVHCSLLGHLKGEGMVTNRDLDCMTLLGMQGTIELRLLCKQVVQYGLYKSTSGARNAIDKLETKSLVTKTGKTRKMIHLSQDIGVQHKGNVLLEYKMFTLDAT